MASNEDGQDLLLFDRLCRVARDGAGTARKWTRGSLLAQLRGTVRLKVAPNYQHDINLLAEFSRAGMAEVSEEIVGFRVDRPDLENKIREKLTQTRLVNLTGLPGCGKSAMLKRIASQDEAKGPVLFLKSDRLEGKSWLTFANALNLEHTGIGDLLAEIGAAGTPVLFIDGIDRVRPDQRGVINDILRAIESEERLAPWKVLATSRDQGLEPYRTWFPPNFYRGTGIGAVPIVPFTDVEADALADEMPNLRQLLFGAAGVREIARRPFFAAVLAWSFPDSTPSPQTEVDLIKAWWDRAGHDAPEDAVPLRQRALLDLAERGGRNLIHASSRSTVVIASMRQPGSSAPTRTPSGPGSNRDCQLSTGGGRRSSTVPICRRSSRTAVTKPSGLARLVTCIASNAGPLRSLPQAWRTTCPSQPHREIYARFAQTAARSCTDGLPPPN